MNTLIGLAVMGVIIFFIVRSIKKSNADAKAVAQAHANKPPSTNQPPDPADPANIPSNMPDPKTGFDN